MKKTRNVSQSDEDLVALSLKERDFFGCIVDRYEEKLFRYIRRITNVPVEDVEDLLQESFIKAYIHLNSFDPSLKFSSWIYRITYNHVVSSHRKRMVRPEGNSIDVENSVLENIASQEHIVDDIDKKERNKNLKYAIEKLDNKYKEVIILFFFEEKDYKEISDILEKPIGTISTLLSRSKKRLRQLYDKEKMV